MTPLTISMPTLTLTRHRQVLPAPPRLIDFRGSAVQEARLLDDQGRQWRGVRASPLAPVQLFLELDATGKVPDDQRDVAAAHPGLVQRLARRMQAELQHEGRGFELRWQRPLRKPRSVNPYTWVRFEARASRPARIPHFLHFLRWPAFSRHNCLVHEAVGTRHDCET